MSRLSYLRQNLIRQFSREHFRCPSCGGVGSSVVSRKYIVTQLRRCDQCKLLFRTPTDDPADNASFYENRYVQGRTTALPSEHELTDMKTHGFPGNLNYSTYIDILNQLGLERGCNVFEYGCSWGYGSHQLAQQGFNVVAFEVARSRREFAHNRLGVETIDDMPQAKRHWADQFDCFFSSHVLEHVPSPIESFCFAWHLLKPGGIFVAFVPNGSLEHRKTSIRWNELWGEVHPNFLDDVYLDHQFRGSPRVMGATPVVNAKLPDQPELVRLNKLDRYELFFAARKHGTSWK